MLSDLFCHLSGGTWAPTPLGLRPLLLRPALSRPVRFLELVSGLMSVGTGLTQTGGRADAALHRWRVVALQFAFSRVDAVQILGAVVSPSGSMPRTRSASRIAGLGTVPSGPV